MARVFSSILILIFGFLAGCQQSEQVSLPPLALNAPQCATFLAQSSAPAVVAPPTPTVPKEAIAAPISTPKPAAHVETVASVPRSWVPQMAPRDWQWIVIHHSATSYGSAAVIDGWHRDKGWDELGYHFVIGNGTDSRDGQIEVGPRWTKQKWGAHTKTADNRFNDYGIGICLVGNFDVDHPTPAQMKSLVRLVAYLMETYDISPDRVIGHGEAKPTDCPGRYLNVAEVRRSAEQKLDDSGDGSGASDGHLAAAHELLEARPQN